MTIKLSRGKVEIALRNGDYQTVNAWLSPDGNLACHKDVITGAWMVTHVNTGYSVVQYNGPYSRIRELIEQVSQVIDWSVKSSSEVSNLLHGPDWKASELREIVERI